jgi:hypothetical protein
MFGDHRAVKDFICGRDHGSRANRQTQP